MANIFSFFFSFSGRLNRLPFFFGNLALYTLWGLLVLIIPMFLYLLLSPSDKDLLLLIFSPEILETNRQLSQQVGAVIVSFSLKFLAITTIILIALITPELALISRRLHDLNQSALLSLIFFIPLFNFVFLIYLFFVEGTIGPNTYGNDPITTRETKESSTIDSI